VPDLNCNIHFLEEIEGAPLDVFETPDFVDGGFACFFAFASSFSSSWFVLIPLPQGL